jgi:hypothetical protein
MLEYWNDANVEQSAQCPPIFHHSSIPLVDGFVVSIEAGTLFFRRPLAGNSATAAEVATAG